MKNYTKFIYTKLIIKKKSFYCIIHKHIFFSKLCQETFQISYITKSPCTSPCRAEHEFEKENAQRFFLTQILTIF